MSAVQFSVSMSLLAISASYVGWNVAHAKHFGWSRFRKIIFTYWLMVFAFNAFLVWWTVCT